MEDFNDHYFHPYLSQPPQAQWRGASVAIKLIVSDTQASLAGCVQEAVTGRMLTHPFIVTAYVAAVMTGEEVAAAVEAATAAEEAASQSRLLGSSSLQFLMGAMKSTLSEDLAFSPEVGCRRVAVT